MSDQAEIEYPCLWTFALIGEDATEISLAVSQAVGPDEHELTPSRKSSAGRYLSMRLRIVVRDDAHRLTLHETLAAAVAIRYVL